MVTGGTGFVGQNLQERFDDEQRSIAEKALARETKEELGIEGANAKPLANYKWETDTFVIKCYHKSFHRNPEGHEYEWMYNASMVEGVKYVQEVFSLVIGAIRP